ncbi:MAG TPA: hypothetical protein VG675_07615 [Bryobacteraceae bacterium]|nr:hypothetical protein [Bryobacteraceae bacterium]
MELSKGPSVALCLVLSLAWMSVPVSHCQTLPPPDQGPPSTGQASRSIPVQNTSTQEQLPRRIFGIIPNYRSNASLKDSKPLSAGQKFKLAARESFDPGTFLLSGAIAGIGQASNSMPSYGQGMAGYGRRYGASYGNLVIGNTMAVAVYPSLFRQDPRYFRRGTGSAWSRLGYAMGQVFVTHGDNRKTQFNYSEILGNSTAVAISNAYIPDDRSASDAAVNLSIQLGLDMAGNILKEFAPDLHRPFRGRNQTPPQPSRQP